MSIADELQAELKDAMRARDRRRLDVIRQIQTEVSKRKAEPGFSGQVDDELYREVIAGYVKRMAKAREEYLGVGDRGAEMADKLAFEIDYLGRWLPQKLDEDATRALVRSAIEEIGASDPKEAGKVIGHLMRSHRDELDGALVNRLVREMLTADGS